MTTLPPTIWAVHIADNVLVQPFLWAGFLTAFLLAYLGTRRLHEDEIPRIALLTAAFFVGSLLHVRVPPVTVHLLLNGLVGVLLGRRAALAIPLGLSLQYLLLQHGGLFTLGVNTCVLLLPALAAHALFHKLLHISWLKSQIFRTWLVSATIALWCWTGVVSITLLLNQHLSTLQLADIILALRFTLHPVVLIVIMAISAGGAWCERRLNHAATFPVGLLVGELTVLLTILLHTLVLWFGGATEGGWRVLVLVSCVAHMPIAALEGFILGYTVTFLFRVKPEMLRVAPQDQKM